MMFKPQSDIKIHTEFHPATSRYLSNGTCQHWPSYATASVPCRDQQSIAEFNQSYVSVVQRADETDAETVARAKGMFLRGVRGMYGFAEV
jgi:hypothetical protein